MNDLLMGKKVARAIIITIHNYLYTNYLEEEL